MEGAIYLVRILGLIVGGMHQRGKSCSTNGSGEMAVMEGGSFNPRSLVLSIC
jgi:hypothetical protein